MYTFISTVYLSCEMSFPQLTFRLFRLLLNSNIWQPVEQQLCFDRVV